MIPTRAARRLALLLCVVALAACGSAGSVTTYTRITEAAIAAADGMPAPAGEPVLTIRGDIAAANDGDAVSLDLATIEQIGLVRYTVHDPWLDVDLEFTGVLMSELLDIVGVAPDATRLIITALDDYEVEIEIADVRAWPVMLATQTAGRPMSIEDKGPTRIVFPAHPDIDGLSYKDLWIWQLKSIEVR